MAEFTHLDEQGRARMVDVSDKDRTVRQAVAAGAVHMQPATLSRIVSGDVAKGDVLAVARVAGIGAAKRTPDLVPLCHPVALTSVAVDFEADEAAGVLTVTATATAADRTGVEIEALAAVLGACLCVYDMCKAVDRAMTISDVRLLEKRGGRSGEWTRSTG